MKNIVTYIFLFFQNNSESIEPSEGLYNMETIINVLSIGFITVLCLLIINLIKVFKQKRLIKELESQLNKS